MYKFKFSGEGRGVHYWLFQREGRGVHYWLVQLCDERQGMVPAARLHLTGAGRQMRTLGKVHFLSFVSCPDSFVLTTNENHAVFSFFALFRFVREQQ